MRRPCLFARNRALWNRTLLEPEQRLPCHPVEDEEGAHLGDDGNRRHPPSVARGDVDQRRRGGQIPVPDVVVHELVKPFQPPRQGVDGQERVGVEVLATAIRTVEIGRRGTGRRKEDPALLVHGHVRPDVRARSVLPALPFPCLDPRLARARNGVKGPQQSSGACVPPPDVAIQPGARLLFRVGAPSDNDVLVDEGG